MITLIVPTRNRAYTLREVVHSFFTQPLITEIIFINDAGRDDTEDLLKRISAEHPGPSLKIIRNKTRQGTPYCRNAGINAAANEFILFCDDDQLLEANYAETCYRKLTEAGADIAAGRMIYMATGETMEEAIRRFGMGLTDRPPFDSLTLSTNVDARLSQDTYVPIAHNAIMARKALFLAMPYDTHYSKATGWREEGDFQMNAFIRGYKLLLTNDTHMVHLDVASIRQGGAKTNDWYAIYCVLRNTWYFYSKYSRAYNEKTGECFDKNLALFMLASSQIKARFLRPLEKWARRQPGDP
jgi:glycosyltransferase involved in cell wall biosynthesis